MLNRRRLIGSATAALMAARAKIARAASASPAEADALAAQIKGHISYKADQDYEYIRQFGVFNAIKPNRYPEAIVLAESVDDVVAAVKWARAKGWQVGVRSGGHSWMAQHTRDRAITINLAKLKQIDIDPDKKIAIVSPSTTGDQLNKVAQDQYGLMFPSAHGVGVGLGGFVMCGGHGWNARSWGPGCANLLAVDVVNAKGELLHCTDSENADYLWAARGAGPGQFAAVVRLHLQLHPNPKFKRKIGYNFDVDQLEPVVRWINDNGLHHPKGLELVVIGRKRDGKPNIYLGATAMADTQEEADAMLDLVSACPSVPKATKVVAKYTAFLPAREEPLTEGMPAGWRIIIDGAWTSVNSDTLMPYMNDLMTSYGPEKSFGYLQFWGPVHPTPNMAYSLQGNLYLSSNAIFTDATQDDANRQWVHERVLKLKPISVGGQMNDENMVYYNQPYLSSAVGAKLERLRKQYDPEHRFVGFLKAKV